MQIMRVWKIGRAWKVLRTQAHPIGIGRAACQALLITIHK